MYIGLWNTSPQIAVTADSELDNNGPIDSSLIGSYIHIATENAVNNSPIEPGIMISLSTRPEKIN